MQLRATSLRAIKNTALINALTLADLWSAGQLGLWYDASDMATLFQDIAGATPVTAVTQKAGRQLDKSGRANHAYQATSAARPEWSARVNLLTKTEDFTDAAWSVQGATKTTGIADPDGTNNAVRIAITSNIGINFNYPYASLTGMPYSGGGMVKGNVGEQIFFAVDGQTPQTLVTFTGGWQSVTNAQAAVAAGIAYWNFEIYNRAGGAHLPNVTFDVYKPSLNYGSVATRYQRVNTATDYDTVGFPFFLALDGVDDSMSTASFAAGTLGADMDCFIAVRRSSAAFALLLADSNLAFFACLGPGDSGPTNVNAGSPSYVVNGLLVNSGAAITRDQLAAAMPVGAWLILEIRNLNLSGFLSFGTSSYPGLPARADIAQIVLAPAGDAAQRQRIRTYLGAKVGLTL